MARIFGTDGVRGRANLHPITTDFALRLGQALANVFTPTGWVIIGRDTRRSGEMLQNALAAGLQAWGFDVALLDPLPTPALAHLVRSTDACGGVMLTASHNPAEDNGFKIFGADGMKLDDDLELRVEGLIEGQQQPGQIPENSSLGVNRHMPFAADSYIEYAKSAISCTDLTGLNVVIDCANGATTPVAEAIFCDLGANVIAIAVEPDGTNINRCCGAMDPAELAKTVVREKADIGIAFDGDGDRVVLCDRDGNIINGDALLGICAAALHEANKLKYNTAVVTVMSNLGLHKSLEARGIAVSVTAVGDRSVLERMETNGFNFGGEESGHIIYRDFATTGDGIVSALNVLDIMKAKNQDLASLARFVTLYPSSRVNMTVDEKRPLESLTAFQDALRAFEAAVGDNGRHLVRYSGTENKLRILVEAESEMITEEWIKRLEDAARKELCR